MFTFTEADIAKRRSELTTALRQARTANELAALNAATGEGTQDAHDEAFNYAQKIEQKLAGLAAAESGLIKRRQKEKIEAKRQAWFATERAIDEATAQVSKAADDSLEPLIEQVDELVNAYCSGRSTVSKDLGKFSAKYPLGIKGRSPSNPLAFFNMTAGKDVETARDAVKALRALQDKMRSLPSDAHGAMSEMRPDCAKEAA